MPWQSDRFIRSKNLFLRIQFLDFMCLISEHALIGKNNEEKNSQWSVQKQEQPKQTHQTKYSKLDLEKALTLS